MNKSKNVITKLCLSFLLLGIFFLFSSKTAHAATYCTTDSGNCYVDGVGGLDTNNGKTTTTAWKTIQQAANTVGAGDTVNVKGGITYTETVTPANSGSSGNYITYQAWAGTGRPIIDGSSSRQYGFFSMIKDYIKIIGFEIRNTTYCGISIGMGNYVYVINNIVVNNPVEGILFTTMGVNSYAYHNLVINSREGINAGSATGAVIKNNILINNIIALSSNGMMTFIHDNNLYWNNTNDYSPYNNISAAPHDVHADPLFVDSANNDFHLQKGSPAINAGATLSDVTTDILGVARPQGSAYDIGAYEYYDIPVILTSVPLSSSNVSSPSFTGIASTIGAGTISSVSYSVDGGAWDSSGVTGTTSFAFTIPYVADGTHTVRVRATDSYGNSSDSTLMGTFTFYINTITTKGPPVCGNSITSGTPNLFEIRTNKTTATLFFTPPTPPYSSFYIAYSTKPDLTQYGVEYNQSYSGNGGVLNYTINMLQPNTKYYFTIRAGNDCTTGNWGNTLTAVTTTSTIQRTYYKNFPIVINNLLPKK